jgi:hypothetical protein
MTGTMSEQHDNHCWLTLMGRNWWIARVDRPMEIIVLAIKPGYNADALMCTDACNWEAYCAMACD